MATVGAAARKNQCEFFGCRNFGKVDRRGLAKRGASALGAGIVAWLGPARCALCCDEGLEASRLAFDERLRRENAAWGIRRREDVQQEAWRAGFVLRERHAMPANNLLLVFQHA